MEKTELQRDEFFEELKRIRESKGIRLEEISRRYKIRLSFLEAIENGSFEDLPEPVYTKTFVKTYAGLLGLDAGPILARYARHIEKTMPAPQPDHQTDQADPPRSERALFDLIGKQGSRVGWAVFAAAVVIVLGIWTFRDRADRPIPVKTVATEAPKPPENPQETPAQAQAPAPQAPQQEAAPPPQQAAVQAPAPPAQAAARQPAPEPGKPEPALLAPGPAALSLKIEAVEAAWVQVRADRTPAVQKLMQAGETLTAEAREKITVDLGNAGGVQITFQDKPLGSPGKRGEVMHLVFPEGKRVEKKKQEEPRPSGQTETE